MPLGWNAWYHVTVHTYGQWVRGDRRGWRARHHREHCEGDYKNRPDPNEHRDKLKFSLNNLTHDPVKIAVDLTEIVLNALIERLIEYHVEIVCAAMDGVHVHLLGKFPNHDVRKQIGWSKLYSTTKLKAHCDTVGFNLDLEKGQGIWGKRCGVTPITSRQHQIRVVKYILNHAKEGATLWKNPDHFSTHR